MRILHAIPYMHPHAGGPPVAIRHFIHEFERYGHTAEIITTTMFCENDESAFRADLDGLAPSTVLPESRLCLLSSRSIRSNIAAAVMRADLVHLHTLWGALNVLLWRICRRLRKPYCVMPHGYLDPYSLRTKRWRKAIYLPLVEAKIIAGAAGVVYTTKEERDLASSQLGVPTKSFIVPLGADAPTRDHLLRLGSAFLTRFPKARGRRQLLFLGRLDHKKGLEHIISMMPAVVQAFPDVLLTIVGRGAASYERRLQQLVEKCELQHHVLMTGWLHGCEKWGAYASAEIFLLPSEQENFAITVAEAMQSGIPLVVSRNVNSWPYVSNAGAGLVVGDELSISSLRQSVFLLLRDSSLRDAMGRRGESFGRTRLTWERSARHLLACYRECLR